MLCLGFFSCAVGVLLVGLAVSGTKAQVRYLTVPFDNYGHACGLDEGSAYPRLYFDKSPATFFCVAECPADAGPPTRCLPLTRANQSRPCPASLPTVEVLHFCLPNASSLVDIQIPEFQKLMSDTVTVLPLLGGAAGFSLALGLCLLLLSRLCMGALVWGLLLLSLLVNAAVCLLSFLLAIGNSAARALVHWDELPELVRDSQVMTGVAAVTLVLLLVQLLVMCCMCGKVRVAIMVLKGSA